MARKKAGRPRVKRRTLGAFARALVRARNARELSQQAAAQELGISWRAYIRYELGEREPWGPALPFFRQWIDAAPKRAKEDKR
jgi:transcriptional regulator with XRE-family HTH domain